MGCSADFAARLLTNDRELISVITGSSEAIEVSQLKLSYVTFLLQIYDKCDHFHFSCPLHLFPTFFLKEIKTKFIVSSRFVLLDEHS